MQLRRLSLIVASLTLVIGITWAGAALAVGPEDDSAFYLGIGAGFGFENFDGTGGVDIDKAFGLDAWGGYKFNKWIATELQLEYLNGFEVDRVGIKFQGRVEITNFCIVFGQNIDMCAIVRLKVPGSDGPRD